MHYRNQDKISRLEQNVKLLPGALSAPCTDQHVEVREFAFETLIGGSEDAFDHDQFAWRPAGATARSQKRHSLIILPIVKNEFEQVGIAVRRDLVEKVSLNDFAPCDDACLTQYGRGGSDDVRLVE